MTWEQFEKMKKRQAGIKPISLSQHDAIYHKGGYKAGSSCQYRESLSKYDPSDDLFGSLAAHHGMFDDSFSRLTPQEEDAEALKSACAKLGVVYPNKGKVRGGRWDSLEAPRYEYTVVDRNVGLFASGRARKDYMVLARPEEAMSFSSKEDAEAVAKAVGGDAKVLDKKGYESFVQTKSSNPIEFPNTLTESDLNKFRVTLNGSTEPYVGKIGNSMFIAKRGSHTSDDHVENEHVANQLHIAAGLNAPRSKIYKVAVSKDERTPVQKYMDMINGKKNGGTEETVMLAEYIPNAVSLEAAWKDAVAKKDEAKKKTIRDQVLAAYPFESFVAGIDLFQNDNALVDSDGKLWMVDNGAAFDYRARGGRKGWFDNRVDPADKENGLMSLLNHKSQTLLRGILAGVSEQDVIKAASRYDFEDLVTKLPVVYQTPALKQYAKALNDLTGINTQNGDSK